jgi:hypothetical protein
MQKENSYDVKYISNKFFPLEESKVNNNLIQIETLHKQETSKNTLSNSPKYFDIIRMSRNEYHGDSLLGGQILRIDIWRHDNENDLLLNDSRISKFQIEIQLREGFLSWADLLNITHGVFDEFDLYSIGEVQGFEVIPADSFFMPNQYYVEPMTTT